MAFVSSLLTLAHGWEARRWFSEATTMTYSFPA